MQGDLPLWLAENHRIIEFFKLEKTFKITEPSVSMFGLDGLKGLGDKVSS